MNKASFDRKYKAIKGHLLEEIQVVRGNDPSGVQTLYVIQDIYYDPRLDRILIVIKD